MSIKLWLRAETKPAEKRTALTPDDATKLRGAGFDVMVEKSPQSVIPALEYAAAGCQIVEAGSWQHAPRDAFVLGLKELPEHISELHHRHIYFAHAYKKQLGWKELLNRFVTGGGSLYDIEYLLDENSRRVAAFGYWAGYAGFAVAVQNWSGQQLGNTPVVSPINSYPDQDALVGELKQNLALASTQSGHKPTAMLIGAKGRVGSGASQLAETLEIPLTSWDIQETAKGGPFADILEHDIFVNCVLVNKAIRPFITQDYLSRERQLSVIADVSCDPFSPYNPLPVYQQLTSFANPSLRVIEQPPLDVIAIDHLPSMLPLESSREFSAQLTPHLLGLADPEHPVWTQALRIFYQKTNSI